MNDAVRVRERHGFTHSLDNPQALGQTGRAQLASELAIPVTQVTNYLAFARRELRRLLLERLRSLCATDEEFRLEARELLGADPTSRPA